MTRSRDEAEFSPKTKETLAKRAGFRCAFPTCGSITTGPSAEGDAKVASTGMACHIYAAATGPSARRVSTADPETLSEVSNGVWMCYKHGKLIDADEATYTVEQLRRWRALAERRADLSHAQGRDVHLSNDDRSHPLAEGIVPLTSGDLATAIDAVLREACAYDVWARQAVLAVRDLLIELARNAFEHGGATSVSVVVEPRAVKLIDNGAAFDLMALRRQAKPGGGHAALRALANDHGVSVVATGRREGDFNVVYVAAVTRRSDLIDATPCHIRLSPRGKLPTGAFEQVVDCDTVYLVVDTYISYSDLYLLGLAAREAGANGRKVVIALPETSTGVAEHLEALLQDCDFIRVAQDESR